MTVLGWVLLAFLLAIVVVALDVVIGFERLGRLSAVLPREDAGAPLVSIVVAAKDEARSIEGAMRSLLAQRYPRLEVIAVDDRSTDETGNILDRLAAASPLLRVVHLESLPEGWLGKNHALARGAEAARGEWLLFTDADIVMQPEVVARAIAAMESRSLDHLSVMPDLVMPGFLLEAFGLAFMCFGMAMLRPWKARDPRSWRFVGIGAFNLVRRTSYERAGGHAPIRLRPDDDLKLGKLLKRTGARSDLLLGYGLLSVEWYASVGAAIDGLMKNSFSVVEYRTLPMLAGVPFYLLGGLGPLALLLLGPGPLRLAAGAAVLAQLGVLWRGAVVSGTPRRAMLPYPVVSLLFAWIILRALALNLWQGGIVWRGTFYPLTELKKNKV